MLDPTGNFIISTVDTAPDTPDEGLTLTVDSVDEGLFTSLMVTGAFNAVVWPLGVEPRITNAEIIRITDITDGVFTIERGQEGTTARNIASGWNIAVTPTSKTITDIWEEIELRFNKTGGEISGDATITDGNALELENPDGDSVASLYNNGTTGVNALETDSDFKSLGNITANNLSGTNTGDQVIPEDVSDLTDTTGIIPADVSDLTDTTGVIPADVSDLTDTTGIISDKADKSNVLELDNTTSFTPDADYEPATKKYVDDNGGAKAVYSVSSLAEFIAAVEDTTYDVKYIYVREFDNFIFTSNTEIEVSGRNYVYGWVSFSGEYTVTWTSTAESDSVEFYDGLGVYSTMTFTSVSGLTILVNWLYVDTDCTLTLTNVSLLYVQDNSDGTVTGSTYQTNWFLSPSVTSDNTLSDVITGQTELEELEDTDSFLVSDHSASGVLKKVGLGTIQGYLPSTVSLQTDCSGGTSDTYGALSGTINGSNTTFTVSLGSYVSGSLQVYLNGQLQTQGTSEDWDETTPGSGTFDFNIAPVSGDIITVIYQYAPVATGNSDTVDGKHAPTGNIVGTTDEQTLTNKTIDGTSNTFSNIVSENLKNTVGFHAYINSGDLTVNDTTFTKVPCDTEVFDTGSDYDNTTNYRFTAPVTGVYHFDGQIALQGVSDGDRALLTLYVNGSEAKRGVDVKSGGATDLMVTVSTTIKLTANQYVELYVYYDGTGSKVTVGPSALYNWFSGFLVGII